MEAEGRQTSGDQQENGDDIQALVLHEGRGGPQSSQELREALRVSSEETQTLLGQVRTVNQELNRIDEGRQAEIAPILAQNEALRNDLADTRRRFADHSREATELAEEHLRLVDIIEDLRSEKADHADIIRVVRRSRDMEATNAALSYRDRHIAELDAIIDGGYSEGGDSTGGVLRLDAQDQQAARQAARIQELSEERLSHLAQLRALERRAEEREQAEEAEQNEIDDAREREIRTAEAEADELRGLLQSNRQILDRLRTERDELRNQNNVLRLSPAKRAILDTYEEQLANLDPNSFEYSDIHFQRNDLLARGSEPDEDERQDPEPELIHHRPHNTLREEHNKLITERDQLKTLNEELLPLVHERDNIRRERDHLRNQICELRMTLGDRALLQRFNEQLETVEFVSPEYLEILRQREELLGPLPEVDDDNQQLGEGSPEAPLNDFNPLLQDRNNLHDQVEHTLIAMATERTSLLNEREDLRNQLREAKMTAADRILLHNINERCLGLGEDNPNRFIEMEQRDELYARLDQPVLRRNSIIDHDSPPPSSPMFSENHTTASFRAWLTDVHYRSGRALSLSDEELGNEVALADAGFEDFVRAGSYHTGSPRSRGSLNTSHIGRTNSNQSNKSVAIEEKIGDSQVAAQGQNKADEDSRELPPQPAADGHDGEAVLPASEPAAQSTPQGQDQHAVVPATSAGPPIRHAGRGLIDGLRQLFWWDSGARGRTQMTHTPPGEDADLEAIFHRRSLEDSPGYMTVHNSDQAAAPGDGQSPDPALERPDSGPPLPPDDEGFPEQLRRARRERDAAIEARADTSNLLNIARAQRDHFLQARDNARQDFDDITTARDNLITQLDEVRANLTQTKTELRQVQGDLAERTAERNGARTRVSLLEADGELVVDIRASLVAMAEALRRRPMIPAFAPDAAQDLERLVDQIEATVRQRENGAQRASDHNDDSRRAQYIVTELINDLREVVGDQDREVEYGPEIYQNLDYLGVLIRAVRDLIDGLQANLQQFERVGEPRPEIRTNAGALVALFAERDAAIRERNVVVATRNDREATIRTEMETARNLYSVAREGLERVTGERDIAQTERDSVIAERDAAITSQGEFQTARDAARAGLLTAITQRDTVQVDLDRALEALEIANRELRDTSATLDRSTEERNELQEEIDAQNESVNGFRTKVAGLQTTRANLRRMVLRLGGRLMEDGETVQGEDSEEPDNRPGQGSRRDSGSSGDDGPGSIRRRAAKLSTNEREGAAAFPVSEPGDASGRFNSEDSEPADDAVSDFGDDPASLNETESGNASSQTRTNDSITPPPVASPIIPLPPPAPLIPPPGAALPVSPPPVSSVVALPGRRSTREKRGPPPNYGGPRIRAPRKRKEAPKSNDNGPPTKKPAKKPAAKRPGPTKS